MKLHNSHISQPYYSERNKIILTMRSNGKTITQVSDKINVSRRRVEEIIQELRRMNNCENEVHLISTALRSGVIQ